MSFADASTSMFVAAASRLMPSLVLGLTALVLTSIVTSGIRPLVPIT
jgi:hypothetical protein